MDSLSDEWVSQPRSSSPAGSVTSRQLRSSVGSTNSQSRIPHLAQNIRRESHGGFLKPRSQRGLAKTRTEPVLTDRSASSLNLPPPNTGSQKRASISTLPRRTSNALSESQNSVQHHSVADRSTTNDAPEWKQRLANGQKAASGGLDLFAPSKLEGMFTGPAPRPDTDTESSLVENLKPWKPFDLSAAPTINEQYQSLRASRSRPPGMEVLQEVDEDRLQDHDFSAISSDIARHGSLRGLVRQRVHSLERGERAKAGSHSPESSRPSTATGLESANDPRWRTISGRQELENELISPITASRQNTIRDRAVQLSMDMDVSELDGKLAQIGIQSSGRPSSSSSDRAISYRYESNLEYGDEMGDLPGDITSNSLPDDLSMGTQDFISHGGFVNKRRGAPSVEVSYLRRTMGSQEQSQTGSREENCFRSSPPPYSSSANISSRDGRRNPSLPSTPQDESVVRHGEVDARSVPSGSPLKLFSNKDTYTNTKLMRILSHYDTGSDEIQHELDRDEQEGNLHEPNDEPNALQVSQFGRGELNEYTFDFEKQVSLSPVDASHRPKPTSIFTTKQIGISRVVAVKVQESQGLSGSAAVQSPIRSPKRRRTLIQEEINIDGQQLDMQVNVLHEVNQYAGKKRTDAKPGSVAAQADASTLASRTVLFPKMSRKSSAASVPRSETADDDNDDDDEQTELHHNDVTEALAAELASFAQGKTQNHIDSRKPSLATKDYMEEANKVMQLIRNKGKPKMPEIEEPNEASELDPDNNMDLDIDDESTKDPFSRPPSREGPQRSSPDRRHVEHDSQTADHLRKYQEDDELEALANTSVFGTLKLADANAAREAARVPVPDDSEDEQESSPPNMRILNASQSQRKRKYSVSTAEGQTSIRTQDGIPTQGSASSSSHRTFPTSSSSGHRGMITHGTVSIPDQVGTMTFDHQLKIWVPAAKPRPVVRKQRAANSEADPFESIPDLSIDEQQEEDAKTSSRRNTLEDEKQSKPASVITLFPETNDHLQVTKNGSIRSLAPGGSIRSAPDQRPRSQDSSTKSEFSEHEARLHNGLASQPPPSSPQEKRQARSVTIAFSSPLVSSVKYPDHASVSDATLEQEDDEDDLPLDDSILSATPKQARQQSLHSTSEHTAPAAGRDERYEQYRAMTFNRRPISRISERDEEDLNAERSLVHVSQYQELTPLPRKQQQMVRHRPSKAQNSSILCLTPLSEFSLHQIDHGKHPEESFVEDRAHPKALRQAHGSLALSLDALVKAITDAEPTEIFWEQIRTLRLENRSLTSLHGLDEYCSLLEELSAINNNISHLSGVPASVRVLDIQSNSLTSLVSWGHLHNLQYVDVSGNQLDNLDAFGCLVHLRKLAAKDNRITNVDGILDLNGLLELDLNSNALTEIDFGGTELVRLTKLDLSNNSLTSIRGLKHLRKLEALDASRNNLHQLDETPLSLQDLKLAHNALSAFDLSRFPTLRTLNLDSNALSFIGSLSGARHLITLSLRSQSIASGLIDIVLSTPNECRNIYISSNSVVNGSFMLPAVPQHNLRVLEIAACGISGLPDGFGDFFPNVRNLNLNFNAIKDLSPLQGMRQLKHLHLARNRIKKLRRTCLVLSRLQEVHKADLRDNPLTLGMYAPDQAHDAREEQAAVGDSTPEPNAHQNTLPHQKQTTDETWTQRIDETTHLRRLILQQLLAEGCPHLSNLNGLPFNQSKVFETDQMRDKLTQMGVLARPVPSIHQPHYQGTVNGKSRIISAQEMPTDGNMYSFDGQADEITEIDQGGNDSGVDVTDDRIGVETYADEGRIEIDEALPLSAEDQRGEHVEVE